MASGRSSRAKGVAGERESADIFRRHGFEVVRLQNNVQDAGDYIATLWPEGMDAILDDAGIHLRVESKRAERFNLITACKQVESLAFAGEVPCVVHRRSREPWRVTLPLEDFARLLGGTT